jgi:hypothetical protein
VGGTEYGAARAMGCCQDKDFQTSDEQAKDPGLEEGEEGGTRDTKRAQGAGEEGAPKGLP